MYQYQELSYSQEAIRKKEYDLTYSVLDTVHETLYKQTWHKLKLTYALWRMITQDKGRQGANWDIVKEIDGQSYIWVTDKYLALLNVKGAYCETETS
jgi:hypothetical protein